MAAASFKVPPKLDNESKYETWKKDVKLWCALTDLTKHKQALAVHLNLSGRARLASSELTIEELSAENGISILIAKLDKLFLADKGRRQFGAFNDLYKLRRRDDATVKQFIVDFEHEYYCFKQEDMSLPDSVIAFMLLSSCNLLDTDVHLVMSALSEVTYDNMKAIILRIFGSNIHNSYSSSSLGSDQMIIKTEPAFVNVEHNSEIFYNYGNRRGRGRGGPRGRGGFRGARGRGLASEANVEHPKTTRKMNPKNRDGSISRCLICDSKFHWARDCPDAYERGDDGNTEVNIQFSLDEDVQLSLYAQGSAGKVSVLMEESLKHALLDTGSPTTVCGEAWLNDYINSLTDHQCSLIRESESVTSFTFGDSRVFKSIKRITLPCFVGGYRATIETDVVECNLPLLMSVKSMKAAKMRWDFAEERVELQGKSVPLKKSSSNHYLIPLSL